MTLLIINKSRLMPTGAKASHHGRLFLFHHLPQTEAHYRHGCYDGNACQPQENLENTVHKFIHNIPIKYIVTIVVTMDGTTT